ncbi:hypothetical protein FRC09_013664 [Ceratobasidium sp. 395]|nr:hypothetical protein FRC09_013664 [Ceratobasidium sp. 395]
MRAFTEEPWSDPQKIIIGIDIGATHSAVSFAFLYPSGPQSLYRVANWPGQDSQKGECKIPTIIYYDRNGKAVSFGAEAARITAAEAEEQDWRLARHFKLHLHPKTMRQKYDLKVQPLPDGISLEKVYIDFMVYLMKHTQATFESRVIGGVKLWKELRDDMTIVLAHPNGWTIKEQNFLRKAAIEAKYTTEAQGHARIHFVSEAEASMHFCMFHSNIHRRIEPGICLIVCDAGGSTVDTTAYRVKNISPVLELEEIKASACTQAGGVFVDLECQKHLSGILDTLGLDEEERDEYIQNGVKDFESFTKQSFGLEGPDGSLPLQYRVDMRCRLQQLEHKIRRGVITLTSETVKTFFDSCVEETIKSIRQQMLGFNSELILLVGGFGDSPYLRQKLLSEFNNVGCSVTIANDSTSKAVADGAVIWSAKLSVIRRTTRMSYGTDLNFPYDSRNPDHGVVMNTTEVIRSRTYHKTHTSHSSRLGKVAIKIYAYTGVSESPDGWLVDTHGAYDCSNGCNYFSNAAFKIDNLNKGYEEICEVKVDLSGMGGALEKKKGPDGDYYKISYTIALHFGGTELRAFLEWEEDGKTRTGPASIVPSALTTVQN